MDTEHEQLVIENRKAKLALVSKKIRAKMEERGLTLSDILE